MKKALKIVLINIFVLSIIITLFSCGEKEILPVEYYDLSLGSQSLSDDIREDYTYAVIDRDGDKKDGEKYLAHPDMINLIKDGKDVQYVFYVNGHGRGETRIKKSVDNGKSWEPISNLPSSFQNTQETPCAYTLNFNNGSTKYILISGRPGWSTFPKKGEGFDVSISSDLENWSEHENFYGPMAKESKYYAKKGTWNCIVAMASLVRVKENGEFVDKWIGFFHDYDYSIYSTVLTFEKEKMKWSKPVKVFDAYRNIEKKVGLCEPLVLRSPDRKELLMLMRANKKNSHSMYSISVDEGKTWSQPQETSLNLTGERHKAIQLDDSRFMITMRKIDYYNGEIKKSNFYSRGFCAWIGNYEDIKSRDDGIGDLIKIEHTYNGNEKLGPVANGDTGYAGIIKTQTGDIIVASYGRFDQNDITNTMIIAKTINIQKFYQDVSLGKIVKVKN